MPTIYILIGPPGSGKSTWRAAHPDMVALSSDDIIERHAAAAGKTYSEFFPEADWKAINEEIEATMSKALSERRDIVVDRTNMTEKSRRSYLSRMPRTYRRHAIVFQIERSILNERLATRSAATGKYIPDHVVDQMLASYEEPSFEHFDLISHHEGNK